MLWTIATILLVFWMIGLATHVMGDFIHILFLLAVAAVLMRIIRGGKAA
ncbi:MAG: lmo0937 family membrane protein [Vampirovibrionales bacterium]|nr:lmo0937 family membrane protein [Vampirovibrionales bacterium]